MDRKLLQEHPVCAGSFQVSWTTCPSARIDKQVGLYYRVGRQPSLSDSAGNVYQTFANASGTCRVMPA